MLNKSKGKTLYQLIREIKEAGCEYELLGRYEDEDILRELEIRGIPEDVLKTFKDYLAQPVVTQESLEKWLNNSVIHAGQAKG